MEEDMSGTAEITAHRRKRAPAATVYKGVVLQHNGRWGAQIYADHRRVWLGTFKSEAEAAAAFDAASVRLRPSDSHRNFPRSADAAAARGELDFQSRLSTDALLAAIRDGSYRPRLAEFLRGPTAPDPPLSGPGPGPMRQLFRKELTLSDVGKLNRLVIPKRHAVRHFAGAGAVLMFRDSAMRAWKFRYCYWRSSQSYVLTRGWNRFVRENRLRQNDTVAFYSCERAPGGTFLVIDAVRAGPDEQEQQQVLVDENKEAKDGHDNNMPVGVRLFGVQINA